MTDAIRLYGRLLGASVRSQIQYPASFLMQGLGTLVITGIEFLAIYVLFERFGGLKGWTLPEVALLYAMANLSFAFGEWAGRGFDTFAGMVKSGDFDRVLLRPRTAALQIAGKELAFKRFGRALQALIVLGWAMPACGIAWTPAHVGLLASAILGGALLFYGIFVLHATLCFWTIESLELTAILSNGGVESAQYPMDIYAPWFQRFFTYVIPLMFVNYFPGRVLLRPGALTDAQRLLGWCAPLAGMLFLVISFRFWVFGVRRYRSTGS